MLQDRKLIPFLLLPILMMTSLFGEVVLKGAHLIPTLPNSWTDLGFFLENRGSKTKTVSLKIVVGAIENASAFTRELTIPSKCSWKMNMPIYVPSNEGEGNILNRRRVTVTIYLNQGGALLHREEILGPLLRNDPMNFLAENFTKPSDRWSVGGLWNSQNWQSNQGSIKRELEQRRMRRRSSEISLPFLDNHLKNRILVFESLKSIHSLESASIMSWVEKGGLLILSESTPETHALHEALSFLPIQKSWSSPGSQKKPFTGVLHHFSSAWKNWSPKGDTIGHWRELGHGSVLVTEVPIRELMSTNLINWDDITLQGLTPSPSRLWEESGGTPWMQKELLKDSGTGMWSRNLVGIYLLSLLIASIGVSQLPTFKTRRELRWGIWCGLSLVWCIGGFVFYLFNTDASTRMESVEIIIKKVSTPGEDVMGLSQWRSGSKRRLDLRLDDFSWEIEGTQDAFFRTDEAGLRGWELRPGESKTLSWKGKSQAFPMEDPSLKLGIQPRLEIPTQLVGQSATIILGDRIWTIDSLNQKETLDPSSAVSVDQTRGPFSGLLKEWLPPLSEATFSSRPIAWLFIKADEASPLFKLPENVKSKNRRWFWYVFPTSTRDGRKMKLWSHLPANFIESSVAHLSTSPDL